MSVQQIKSVVAKRENGSTYLEPRWAVFCDQCKNVCDKDVNEAGLADYHARRAGYKTVNLGTGKSMRWVCPICARRLARKVIA
jgi:hypothetical protein